MLPYPGRYESFNSWDSRCKAWENDRDRWRKEQAARSTNWGGYHYTPVENFVSVTLPDGKKVEAVKVGYGWRNRYRVKAFAARNFLAFAESSNGLAGICERKDGIAYKAPDFEAYNNDNH